MRACVCVCVCVCVCAVLTVSVQRTGSVTDITLDLVNLYIAWTIVGHWAVVSTVLSPPCLSNMWLYPLALNTAVVVMLVTSFVCRCHIGW